MNSFFHSMASIFPGKKTSAREIQTIKQIQHKERLLIGRKRELDKRVGANRNALVFKHEASLDSVHSSIKSLSHGGFRTVRRLRYSRRQGREGL